MSTMNIDHILSDLPDMDPAASILLRGDHGIGKSSLVRQLTRKIKEKEGRKDYPVIDRRLSQLTQGDIIGLPKLDEDRTRYMPPDWYKTACERPVVLFLDELNRAEVEVMQAAFQIVLDRELNGHRLHPETRVYSAVNTGASYNVNQMDPALLDRFFVIDVNFTIDEWIKWAKTEGSLTPEVIDFIIRNPAWLTTPKKFNPGSVVPSPRSWEFADKNIRSLIVEGRQKNVYDMPKIRRRMAGYLGIDASMAFVEDLSAQFRFSGEDIMERYAQIRDLIKRDRVDVMVSAVEKVETYCAGLTTVNENQAANLKLFIWDLEKDHRVTLWQRLAKGGNARLPFIRSIHASVAHAICDAFGVPVGPKGIGVLPGVHAAVIRSDEKESA
jgi:GTPase SAR1 family protein